VGAHAAHGLVGREAELTRLGTRLEAAGRGTGLGAVIVGQWQIWDQAVFDAFTVAGRPPGATQICAVVGTSTHAVDDPTSFDRIAVPH
jgi:hypothetical protein